MGLIAGIRRNERPSVFATHFLVSVMLVCLASLLIQVGQRLAPGWNGRYLVIVAFLAAVESFITKRSLKRASVFSSVWLTRRGIEFIVMLVALKATLYLLRDPSQFWRDLPTWRTDFLNHFFTGEYFVAVMFVILIWLIGGAFTDSLLELEGDAEFIEEEARVGLRSDRPAARQQLARQFFVVGGIMLALIVGTHLWYPKGAVLARYDFLTLAAVAIQAVMLAMRMETWEAARVIAVFHIVGTVMEIFKTAMGSWIYPEPSILRIAGVPLFTGFMYACVGSFIVRCWRLFDFQFTGHPPLWTLALLSRRCKKDVESDPLTAMR